MESQAPPSAVGTQTQLQLAANRFKDLLGGIFREVQQCPPHGSPPLKADHRFAL
jgi:hypothetical protein